MPSGPFQRSTPRRDVYAGLDALEVSGAHIGGPPLILGHRGAPREAPENTLASLRRALELGVDGVEYDVRACGSGELVVFHDARLDRTTDGTGPLAGLDLRGLYGVDAGSWFGRRFEGEPVPVLDEALALTPERRGERPFHMIELKERGLVDGLARLLEEAHPPIPCRVASFDRETCLDARDAGLDAMLLAPLATEDDRRFTRDERIAAYGVGPGGWFTEGADGDWAHVESWAWSIDDPEELLALARRPLFGINTNEPHRALVARALARLVPDAAVPYPVEAPDLHVEPETLESRGRGEWFGSWETEVVVRNPLERQVAARASVFVPHGAFELDGVPHAFDLEPREERRVRVRISGGAREPGPDPLFAVLLSWRGGPSLAAGGDDAELRAGTRLLFDAPLRRRRLATADGLARRLEMLHERPSDLPATISARRVGRDLILTLENPGGLEDAHLVARLGREVARAGRGMRLRLPAEFDAVPLGVPFSCGIEGAGPDGRRRLRRWAGGLPEGIGHGSAGLLLPLGKG